MKVKITSREPNPLLQRTEVTFEVEHKEGGTPPRLEVKRELAAAVKADPQLVYVRKVETKTGTTTATGQANVYKSLEQAQLLEPEHIITRNAPPKKPEEKPEKPEEKPEEKPAEEKPAEKKPVEKKPVKERPAEKKPVEKKPAQEKPKKPEKLEKSEKPEGKPEKPEEEGKSNG